MHLFTIQYIFFILATINQLSFAMADKSFVNGINSLAYLKQTVDIANEQVATATIKSALKQFFTTGSIFSIAGQVNNVTDHVNEALENLQERPADFKNFNPALNNLEITYNAYIDDVPDFANTVGNKGTNFHIEFNKPVADALSNLTTAILALNTALSEKGFLSEAAGNATRYAGNALVKARSAWTGALNFKGAIVTGSVL